jgi:hypothetical protein
MLPGSAWNMRSDVLGFLKIEGGWIFGAVTFYGNAYGAIDEADCALRLRFTALHRLLAEFRFWYNTVRPHQHLHNFTPMEVWTGVNPFKVKPKKIFRFSGWDGMLKGFYMLR